MPRQKSIEYPEYLAVFFTKITIKLIPLSYQGSMMAF